jgi:hypothetical protein
VSVGRRVKNIKIKVPGVVFTPDLVLFLHQGKDFSTAWAKLPLSILLDDALTNADKGLYCAISYVVWLSKEEACCVASMDGLGALARLSKSTVICSLARLVKAGHVKREGRERFVARLTLTSPAISKREKDLLVSDSPSPADLIKASQRYGRRAKNCPKCGAKATVRGTIGVCDDCVSKLQERLTG